MQQDILFAQAFQDPLYKELLEYYETALWKDKKHINIYGPSEVHQVFLASALARHAKSEANRAQAEGTEGDKAVFFVLPDEISVRRVYEIASSFWPGPVSIFPSREFQISRMDAVSTEQMHERISVLAALETGHRPLILLSPIPLLQALPSREEFLFHSVSLKMGQVIEPDELAEKLASIGYEALPLAENPGQFSWRGDVLDIIPVNAVAPDDIPQEEQLAVYGVRISFFDNEIDQLRFFDPTTQRQVASASSIFVAAAREIIINKETRLSFADDIIKWGENQVREILKQGGTAEQVARVRLFCSQDAERVRTATDNGLVDRWLPLLHPDKTSLLDYLAAYGYRPMVMETMRISQRMDAWMADTNQQIQHLLERGQTTSMALDVFFTGAEVMKRLDKEFACLSFAMIHQIGNGFPSAKRFDFHSRETENFRGYEEQFYETIRQRQARQEKTFVFAPDQARRERLHTELLQHAPGSVDYIFNEPLARGFEWPQARLLLVGSEDLFGSQRKKRRKSKQKAGIPIDFFSDLSPGDMVVHESHGVGVYEGLETLDSNGSRKDYIKIRYAQDDSLFLPMEALDQIRKYVGTDGKAPKLSRLGGSDWNRLKEKARDSIKKLATDLVALYAKRASMKAFVFPEDTVWDKEFAESFPYEETSDQLRTIEEIKRDMESEKVMDRLLCGDVGFGKTEVAFRAMFKAVNGGKQAALIAPTTVLAQQHYKNFIERIGEFPVRVGHLSRFASPAMQKRTLQGLKNGEIDVVIGTHRVLSKDVVFRRLGLLVVDEEQRFGVDHKEKMKTLTPNIDVLSLSATPIPRTLHMSMSGIRDISVIEEAPQDRREVQTFVMEFDEEIIKDAILREISRGGQVFYLFNNTKKILEEARKIENALPGCRVAVAHGQMPESALEDVIHDFVQGEADVLVCTTIIESGIDMPNVNTLIVTQADRLGLSQLYQIKGRVGRSRRQAYAYITYQKDKVINEDAQKRLAAIREYTELGSGFRIALRDLEVRGAGNLLGAEQHGHMEAIGYELYVQMLDEEVRRILQEKQEQSMDYSKLQTASMEEVLQGMSNEDRARSSSDQYIIPDAVDCQVELKLDAYLPSSFIADEGQRMDMYRRLADIRNMHDYQDLLDELMDRYGDLPMAAYTLADVSYVQARAGMMGIANIRAEKKHLILQFKEGARPNMKDLAVLLSLKEYKGKLHFSAGLKAHLQWANQAEPLLLAPEKLRKLFHAVEREERKANEGKEANS